MAGGLSSPKQMVAEQGVMVLPADVMLFEGNYFRLGLGRDQPAPCAGAIRAVHQRSILLDRLAAKENRR